MSFYREKSNSDSDDSSEVVEVTDDESLSDEDEVSIIVGAKRRNRVFIIDSDSDEDEKPHPTKPQTSQQSAKNGSSVISDDDEESASAFSESTSKMLSSIKSVNNDPTKRLSTPGKEEKIEDDSLDINSSYEENTKKASEFNGIASDLKEEYSASDDDDIIDTSDKHSISHVSASDIEDSQNKSNLNPSDDIENDESILNLSNNIANVPASTVLDISDTDNIQTDSGSSINNGVRSNIETVAAEDELKHVVTEREYRAQKDKVANLEREYTRLLHLKSTLRLETLVDKGEKLINHLEDAKEKHEKEKQKLEQMVVELLAEKTLNHGQINIEEKKKEPAWDDIKATAAAVQPKTFGKIAVGTLNAQKAVTLDALKELHGSLKTCPNENVLAEDPKGLKVPLMPHQKRCLAWISWREKQTPSGGLLADDMGLGKTLTMIAHILASKEEDRSFKNVDDGKWTSNKLKRGGNLIVCPASLFKQWEGEIQNKCKRGSLTVELYHGPRRENSSVRLAQYDVILTTYTIVMNEASNNGPIFKIRWRRIILDEAHQIRNHKSQTSIAVCNLKAKSRWSLTGTPVHNKELDLYSQLKFLRCAPFDELGVWKRWVADKSTGGQERLNVVISSIMLRRTKVELQEQGFLKDLPERTWELVHCQLDSKVMVVYQKLLLFSRNLFAQFLHQRAEKNTALGIPTAAARTHGPNGEYLKLHKILTKHNRVMEIQQHHILVLLLRLRQICCHPFLILKMLKGNEDISLDDDYEEEEDEHLGLLDQLNKMTLNDDVNENVAEGLSKEGTSLAEASRNLLNPSNPIFSPDRISCKIEKLLQLLREKVMCSDDKAIVVSQWSGLLKLLGTFLKKENIRFDQLDGSLPVYKRDVLVTTFNDPKSSLKVLLLSLTAGGVGLNLMGANHLFLFDLHWNPQLEKQAQDRIYRVGQTKPVYIYKFVVTGTIEEQILALQQKKLDIAESKISNKLTIVDLKTLFNM